MKMFQQQSQIQRAVVAAVGTLISGVALAQPAGPGGAAAGDIFPNARPGECYAKVYIPPTYTTESQQVVRREPGKKLEITPARYETGEETVVVKEASKRIEIIPATYETVEEKKLVRAAGKRLVEVPATYEDVSEQVLKRAGYTTWKAGSGPFQRVDAKTGEIMCLVEVPPEYQTVTKRVLKTPPTTNEVEVPEVYQTIKKTVMKTPPTTKEIEIPAVTRTIKITKMVEGPKERVIEIPGEMQTVSSTKQVTPGRYEWRGILCETNTTRDKVMDIQRALKGAGYDPGPIDGIVKEQTMHAVNAFQKAKGLPVDQYLNIETVKALGVSPT